MEAVLKSFGKCKSYKRNDFIFHVNEPADHVYFLDEGWVKISQDGGEGQGVTLFLRQAGEIFATAEVLAHLPQRKRYARCLTSCDVYWLTSQQFFSLCKEHPELLLQIASITAQRLIDTQNFVETLMSKPVSWRLASLLTKLAVEKEGRLFVNIPITHEEISFLIGCSRQTVTEILNKWKDQGLIDYKRRNITIFKSESLF